MKTVHVSGIGMRLGAGRMMLYRLGVMLAAFVGGMFGAVAVFPLGLGVHLFVIWPLTLVIGALFAALSAAWIGTLLTPNRMRSQLLVVVGVSEVIAVVIGLVLPLVWMLFLPPIPPIYGLGVWMLIVTLGASWATWRYHRSREQLGWEGAIMLGVAAAVAVLLGLLSGVGGVLGVPMSLFIGLPPSSIAWGGLVIVAISTILVLWYARRPEQQLRRDAALTLGLVGLAPLIVIGVVYLASLAGLTGA